MTTHETEESGPQPRDGETEGYSREAAEELVRQAEQLQDLDTEGHGFTSN